MARTTESALPATQPQQHELRLLRLGVVLAKHGLKRTATYDRIARGLFPPPVKYGRAATWPAHECDVMVAAVIAGRSDAELRALVQQLVAARGVGHTGGAA